MDSVKEHPVLSTPEHRYVPYVFDDAALYPQVRSVHEGGSQEGAP